MIVVFIQLPADLAYKISQRLIPANNWLTLGGRLGLISTDEVALRNLPHLEVDNGTYILQKWRDSNKSFKDLIDGKLLHYISTYICHRIFEKGHFPTK